MLLSGEGNGTLLQYSCLENPMDGGTWQATVHGVAKSWTRLSDFTFTFHFHALEKEMATHSSVLAWRIPGMGEPGRLLSMGSHRVGHDSSDLAQRSVCFSLDFVYAIFGVSIEFSPKHKLFLKSTQELNANLVTLSRGILSQKVISQLKMGLDFISFFLIKKVIFFNIEYILYLGIAN